MTSKILDPYHWDGPVVEEPVLVGDEVPTGDVTPWEHFLSIAIDSAPLREHYGPGPHKSGSPQSSHSKGEGAGDVANTAERMTSEIQSSGGTSLRTSGVTPKSGIMVSYPPGSGHSTVIDVSAGNVREKVQEFVASQRDFVTSHADRYIGGWVDGGRLYLDVSRNFPSSRREAAIAAGRRGNQLAVFDLDTFTEIPTGGTGMSEAALREHAQHDQKSHAGKGGGAEVTAGAQEIIDKARSSGTLDAHKVIHEVALDLDEPGSVADALDLDTVRMADIRSASAEIARVSQAALRREGVPEEFTVYRQGDLNGVVSVSTTRLRTFASPTPYRVRISQVLTHGEAVQRGTYAENELHVLGSDLEAGA
jgi:hypothetical protein